LLLANADMAQAQVISVLGSAPPVPGADDQYQTNMPAAANQPPGLNYYFDNGNAPSQTFTTGNAPNGYTLSSLAIYDAGNSGGPFGAQTFTLYIYSINGSAATTLVSYISQSIALPDSQWFVWTNLGAILQPNTQYAWSMHRNGSGWSNVGNVTGDLYPAGQVASIPTGGGNLILSSDPSYDATFDVGLTPLISVAVGQTIFSTGNGAVVPGASLTASAPVSGPAPYLFQWRTDGGSGGALTNIPGATASNLVINTTGFANGFYQYALVASNNTSSATGQVAVLQVQTPIAIPGVIGVKFGFAPGYATADHLSPADNTGVATGQIVPPSNVALTEVGNWNNLLADVPAAGGDRSIAIDRAWTIDHDSAGTPLTNVTMTAAGFNDGWFSGGTGCAAGRLLYDCWKFNTSNGQSTSFGHSYGSLNISGLTDGSTERSYDVIVYINNNNGNYWGNVSANSKVAIGNDVDVDGFNGDRTDPCSRGTPLHTAAGFGNPANYVVVHGVTTSGGAIQINVVMIGGGDFGVSGVELVPLGDLSFSQDILPLYAETVAGDQVGFTASVSNSPAVIVQWQRIGAAVTNDINTGVVTVTNSGVVSSTLTVNNVQPSDSGSYRLKVVNAANSADFSYSSGAPLVVAGAPTALGNINAYYSSQTLVSGVNFYPAWSINITNDLIYGSVIGSPDTGGQLVPGNGNFGLDTANPDPTILSDGTAGLTFATLSTCGNPGAGESVTYTLITNSAPFGFEITNITVFGGWLNNNRDQQKYEILYSTVSDPTNFISLVTPDYNPTDPSGGPSATRVTLVPSSGALAHNVYELRFNFNVTNIEFGYEGYSEIAAFGTPASSIQVVAPTVSVTQSGGTLVVSGAHGTANSGYTLLETTNLASPNWLTNSTGVLDGAGLFTNTIPIGPTPPTRFFRVRIP